MTTANSEQLPSNDNTKEGLNHTEIVTADSIDLSKAAPNTGDSTGRSEMPVSAVARLLGVATSSDLTLLEGKVDLLINKLSLVQAKLEKLLSTLNGLPSGADLERIDVQIGSLRATIKESMAGFVGTQGQNTKG